MDNPSESPIFLSSVENIWWQRESAKATKNQKLPPAFRGTPENISKAKNIISNMHQNGGTNIYQALGTAVNISNEGVHSEKLPRPLIIFLTDGDATTGNTNSEQIIEMVEKNNKAKASLFTLAFGSDANKDFLKKISLKNSGFMRHIYVSSDASLQLQDFYKGISLLLLADIDFKYSNVDADLLTKHNFDSLFDGGEIVVAGKLDKLDSSKEEFNVHALTAAGPIDFPPNLIKLKPEKTVPGQMERLWAYMSIKQLLDQAEAKNEKEGADKKRALELALKVCLYYYYYLNCITGPGGLGHFTKLINN